MGRPRKRKLAWTKKASKAEVWYWYRDADRYAVLHVFDPLGNGTGKPGTGITDC